MDHGQFGSGSAAAQGVRAQLTLAMLLAALFPILLLYHPIQTHSVKLNLYPTGSGLGPAAPPHDYFLSIPPPLTPPDDPADYHRLEVTPDERIVIDGAEVDLAGLR